MRITCKEVKKLTIIIYNIHNSYIYDDRYMYKNTYMTIAIATYMTIAIATYKWIGNRKNWKT